jgi:chromosome partitioning protein
MGRIIAIVNQKGGVGKTTTNINLTSGLAMLGRKVLAIDSDPQGNTTSGLGIKKDGLEQSLYELLLGECYINEATYNVDKIDNLEIIPANINLSGAEIELITFENRENILKKTLEHVRYLYDFIFIDCPPSLSILTINALTAADSILIPLQCEYFALEGLSQLIHTYELVKKMLNPNLTIEGILMTMFDARTNLSAQVVDDVKQHFPNEVIQTMIPRSIRLSEAPSFGQPIHFYDPKSRGAEAYMLLAEEMNRRYAHA